MFVPDIALVFRSLLKPFLGLELVKLKISVDSSLDRGLRERFRIDSNIRGLPRFTFVRFNRLKLNCLNPG